MAYDNKSCRKEKKEKKAKDLDSNFSLNKFSMIALILLYEARLIFGADSYSFYKWHLSSLLQIRLGNMRNLLLC